MRSRLAVDGAPCPVLSVNRERRDGLQIIVRGPAKTQSRAEGVHCLNA